MTTPMLVGAAPELPSVDDGFVARPEVLRRLDEATDRVAVVIAPSGYGATSHVGYWAARQPRPVAWVTLQPWSDEPAALLRALVDAVAGVVDLDVSMLPPVKGHAVHLEGVVLPEVLRSFARIDGPLVLVLDRTQLLRWPGVLDLVDAVSRHLPRGSTVVLVGHSVSSALLARWRVRPGLVEVRAADLALDEAAALEVLRRRGVEQLPDADQLRALVTTTEGWPVGVILAAVVARTTGVDDWSTVTADHVVGDYVAAEWLDRLPAVDRAWLLEMSVLESLRADLCDHVTQRVGSGALLRRLHDDHSLLVRIDRHAEDFRMHTVLRERLSAEAERLDGAAVRQRHRRASEWFVDHRDIDMAVHHAMRTGDREYLVGLLAAQAPQVHTAGRVEAVASWLRTAGGDPSDADPRWCQVAAVSAFGRLEGRAARTWVEAGLAAVEANGGRGSRLWWELVAFGALISPTLMIDESRGAVAALSPGRWRAVALTALGGHLFAAGEVDEAEQVLREALVETELAQLGSTGLVARATLALLLERSGDREEWHTQARRARDTVERLQMEHSPASVMVWAAGSLSDVGSNSSGLPADWHLARRSLALLGNDGGWASLQARIAMARTALLCGDIAAARTMHAEARDQLRLMPGAAGASLQLAQVEGQLSRASTLPAFGASAISSAELRVLYHLPTNLTLAEIAERLFVSRNTVKSHSLSIYRKLGVESRRQCVDVAREAGLLPASPMVP